MVKSHRVSAGLARQFLEKYRVRYRRESVTLPAVLLDAFQRHSWPGNIRQLENVIRRYVVLQDQEMILADLYESPSTNSGPDPSSTSLKQVSAQAAV